MDRNRISGYLVGVYFGSLSARRAWIEIRRQTCHKDESQVALRKESVDRNPNSIRRCLMSVVALRKESVDRNLTSTIIKQENNVALRKESVDRNRSSHTYVLNR